MERINLGKNVIKARLKAGMTQEQLAEYLGVSKSAVSKWENGMTYPDITLLPELATLFNLSVDTLMGYAPQLTKKQIIRIYTDLSALMARGEKTEALEKCEEYTKKYYSCFPFLLQIVVFYMNHFMLLENGEEILNLALSICRRIQRESPEPANVKDAVSMETNVLMIMGKADEVLALLGEEAKPISQEAEMIAEAFRQLGNLQRSKEITQICYYQHVLMALGDGCIHMMLNMDNLALVEETIKRLQGIMDIFHVDQLHSSAATQFYTSAAAAYAAHNMKFEALHMLEQYLRICKSASFELHGDDYFDQVLPWLEGLDLGVVAPRNEEIIKRSMYSMVYDNPAYVCLREEPRFQSMLKELENLSRL